MKQYQLNYTRINDMYTVKQFFPVGQDKEYKQKRRINIVAAIHNNVCVFCACVRVCVARAVFDHFLWTLTGKLITERVKNNTYWSSLM